MLPKIQAFWDIRPHKLLLHGWKVFQGS